MMRSLYSGVSGLRNHQTRMDVIANNISNVNTVGYKSSRVVFQDIYSQTAKSASAPTGGSLGGTNPIQIGLGVKLSTIDVLHTSAATSRTDNPLDLAIEGDGYFVIKAANGGEFYTRAGNLYVDNDGNLVTASGEYVQGYGTKDAAVQPVPPVTPKVQEPDTAKFGNLNVKGYTSIAIDENGTITGIPNGKTTTETIGYVAVATFTNPSGLEKVGNSQYAESANSGKPNIGTPNTGGAGKLNPGGLEMSNVDLSAEFTDMIITQRGFQANSRIITTSDSMLEELVNLKR